MDSKTHEQHINETHVFRNELGRIIEVYIEYMLVKNKQRNNYYEHFEHVFATLQKHQVKLNLT